MDENRSVKNMDGDKPELSDTDQPKRQPSLNEENTPTPKATTVEYKQGRRKRKANPVRLIADEYTTSVEDGELAAGVHSKMADEHHSKRTKGVKSCKIPVPIHRYDKLIENWIKIMTPIVKNLGLQMWFNTKTRSVEIRDPENKDDTTDLQKASDFVEAFILGIDVNAALSVSNVEQYIIKRHKKLLSLYEVSGKDTPKSIPVTKLLGPDSAIYKLLSSVEVVSDSVFFKCKSCAYSSKYELNMLIHVQRHVKMDGLKAGILSSTNELEGATMSSNAQDLFIGGISRFMIGQAEQHADPLAQRNANMDFVLASMRIAANEELIGGRSDIRSRQFVVPKHRGAFIAFEGCEGSGKSTQATKLLAHIKSSGRRAVLFPFPDRNEPFGQVIDQYLRKEITLCERSLHIAFSANRWEKVDAIKRQIDDGVDVICDRYAFSEVEYSIAKGMDSHWVRQADIGLPQPDVVLFFEVSPEVAQLRRGFGDERLENEDLQRRYAAVMQTLKKDYWKVVNADGDLDTVEKTVQSIYNNIDKSDELAELRDI